MRRQHKQVNVDANTYANADPTLADLSFGAAGGDHVEPVVKPAASSNSRSAARDRLGERGDRFPVDSIESDQWFQRHIAD